MTKIKLSEQVCNESNEQAWNDVAYEAWKNKLGLPQKVANKLCDNPERNLSVLYPKFGEIKGKKIANIMGSNGTKAIALALLGADVTIFDFSEGNKIYADEVAHHANVEVRYALENIVDLPVEELTGDYDIAFAEMGILHYFTDLEPIFTSVYNLLGKSGKFILRDFHPVSNKLISSRGTTAKIRKHKVNGDYFDTSLVESDISYAKYLPDTDTKKVYLRKWNLGETVTAIAKSGLIIESLEEEPNLSCATYDKGIPKTFTIVARK
jgi:2-polyprenyl-3-methyl-5-hydroxy-6-metoxy-1,4-benzoquinol methylase